MFGIIFFSTVFKIYAATAQVSFTAQTNVPGVVVEGKSEEVSMNFDRKSPQGAVVEFDVFDLKTGMDKRDVHLREKVFAAKKKGDAKIRFEVLEFPADMKGKGTVRGKLQIKEISKEVTLPVTVSDSGLSGKAIVSLGDYSLPRPSFMGVKVEESVEVEFSLKE